jgi:hypothetical protein
MFARWEWIIMELLALGFLVWELVSVRRSIAKDKKAAEGTGGPEEMRE